VILQESKTVPIAEADWTDDGEVELLTYPDASGRTHMTPETARALAQQLIDAATQAEKAAAEADLQRANRTAQHGFDVDLGTLAHDWRWSARTVGDPVCARCGLRGTAAFVRDASCSGSLEGPGVRS
jgi:hypothetical protein